MAHIPRIVPEDGSVSFVSEDGTTHATSSTVVAYRENNASSEDVTVGTNPMPTDNWVWNIRRGLVPGASVVHKFGASIDITTSYAPVTTSKVYQTPQVSGATTLRVKAGNVNDTAAGTGAQEVVIQGLNTDGVEVKEAIATAGTSASSVTTTSWLRIYRLWVSKSGTYATSAAGSHAAAIVIETSGGTEWASIDVTGFPKGQSQIAVYTIPSGKTGYVSSFALTTDGAKPVDFILFKRESILETAAPYQAMRTVTEVFGIQGNYSLHPETAMGPFPGPCDIGWMAKGATTPDVSVDYEILLFE